MHIFKILVGLTAMAKSAAGFAVLEDQIDKQARLGFVVRACAAQYAASITRTISQMPFLLSAQPLHVLES